MRRKKGESEAMRNRAYELYMNTFMTYSEIADAIGVGKDTISDWSHRFKWKETKAANSMTKEKNVSMMLVQMNNILQDINTRDKKFPTPSESDQILKLSQTIDKLSGKTSLPDFFNVMTEFMKYLHNAKPDIAKNIADISKEFLHTKTKELER